MSKDQPEPPSEAEIEEMRSIIGRFPRGARRPSWRVALNSLYAFTLREMRDRFGRSRWGYLWAIAQPILFIVGLTALRTALGRGRYDIYDVSGIYFFLLGVMPFFMFLNGLNRSMGASRSYRALFQFSQVQPIDVIVVRLTLEFLTTGVVMVVMIAGLAWFGFRISIDDVLGFIAVIVALFAFTLGITLMAETVLVLFPDSKQIINIMERPLFLISGIFFTIDHIPPAAREWLLWNPLLHGVDLARGTMLAKYDPIGSWRYFFGSAVFALAAGLMFYRRHRARMVSQ